MLTAPGTCPDSNSAGVLTSTTLTPAATSLCAVAPSTTPGFTPATLACDPPAGACSPARASPDAATVSKASAPPRNVLRESTWHLLASTATLLSYETSCRTERNRHRT